MGTEAELSSRGGRGDAVRHQLNAQPPVVHGGDHGGRCGDRERHPARHLRRAGEASVEGARTRVRPILMTSCAMTAGMVLTN